MNMINVMETSCSKNSRMLDVVKETFDRMELHYSVDEDRQIIQLSMSDKTGANRYLVDVDDESNKFMVYMLCSIRVPEPRRLLAAEYLTRANYGLTIGNFEMDFGDGEVRFKCSAKLPGTCLSTETVKIMFSTAVAMTDRYLEGFFQVLYGNRRPADVIEECESGSRASGETNATEGTGSSAGGEEVVAEQ